MSSLGKVLRAFFTEYSKSPSKLKIIDVYLIYIMLTGAIQFAYMLLVGTFPFNSFLAGFISTLGTFVLTVSLRMQVDVTNKESKSILQERAFADWLFANIVFYLATVGFLG